MSRSLCLGTGGREEGAQLASACAGTRGRPSSGAGRDGPKVAPVLPRELLLHPGFPGWRKAADGGKEKHRFVFFPLRLQARG